MVVCRSARTATADLFIRLAMDGMVGINLVVMRQKTAQLVVG